MEGMPAPLMLNAGSCDRTEMPYQWQAADRHAVPTAAHESQGMALLRQCRSDPGGSLSGHLGIRAAAPRSPWCLKDQKKRRNVYFPLTQRSPANAVSLCVLQLC